MCGVHDARNLAATMRLGDPANLCCYQLWFIHTRRCVQAKIPQYTYTYVYVHKHYERAWRRYLVTARHRAPFYIVDKDAHMSQGFSDALLREKRMDRDEKCGGIIYLRVSLGNEACPRQQARWQLISNSGTRFRWKDKMLRVNNWIKGWIANPNWKN